MLVGNLRILRRSLMSLPKFKEAIMLVKELIERLEDMPQDAPIIMVIAGGEYNLESEDFEPELLKDGTVELH